MTWIMIYSIFWLWAIGALLSVRRCAKQVLAGVLITLRKIEKAQGKELTDAQIDAHLNRARPFVFFMTIVTVMLWPLSLPAHTIAALRR